MQLTLNCTTQARPDWNTG